MTMRCGLYFMALLTSALFLVVGCGENARDKKTSELAHIAAKGDASIFLSINCYDAVDELVRRAEEEGDNEAMQGLILSLDSKNSDIQLTASRTLAKLGTKEAVKPLLKQMDNYRPSASPYYKAADKQFVITLSRLRDDNAVDILITQLMSTDPVLRTLGLKKAVLIASLSHEPIPSRINSISNYERDTWLREKMLSEMIRIKWDGTSLDSLFSNEDPYITSGAIWLTAELSVRSADSTIPSRIDEAVMRLIAKRRGSQALNNWVAVRHVLMKEIRSDEYDRILEAVVAFIGIGEKSIIPELVNILKAEGTKNMAEAYLNSGSGELREAAQKWAKRHGFTIKTGPGYNPAIWGEWR